MIKLVEIYEDRTQTNLKMSNKSLFSLRETYINPDHILYLRENTDIKRRLVESNLSVDLDVRQDVTTVHLNKGNAGLTINVIGSLQQIEEKVRVNKKVLLKG